MPVFFNQRQNDLDNKHRAPVWVCLPREPSPATWPRRTRMKTFLGALQWRWDRDATDHCSLHICNTSFPDTPTSSGAKATSWGSLCHLQTAQLKTGKLHSQNSTTCVPALSSVSPHCSHTMNGTLQSTGSCTAHHFHSSVSIYLKSKLHSDVSGGGLAHIHHNCFFQAALALFFFLHHSW